MWRRFSSISSFEKKKMLPSGQLFTEKRLFSSKYPRGSSFESVKYDFSKNLKQFVGVSTLKAEIEKDPDVQLLGGNFMHSAKTTVIKPDGQTVTFVNTFLGYNNGKAIYLCTGIEIWLDKNFFYNKRNVFLDADYLKKGIGSLSGSDIHNIIESSKKPAIILKVNAIGVYDIVDVAEKIV